MIWFLFASSLVVSATSALRWLRVAQREHYLFPSTSRFWWRWWTSTRVNVALLVLSAAGLIGTVVDLRLGFLTILAQLGPVGLKVRGRTSQLAPTSRLRRVVAVVGVVSLAGLLVGGLSNTPLLVLGTLIVIPFVVDLALLILAPVEKRIGDKWVRKAASTLERSGVRVVAITGSFGKTTTKKYLHHLISGDLRVVASPASFNNRMGLARAVNEHLVPGTEVFIAEMGTYGSGEIADLCSWVQPEISAIVSIGPVHLERFGTEENIVTAKAEILDGARVGVIGIDHPLLAALASERAGGMEVVTVGSGTAATVRFDPETDSISLRGETIGTVPDGVFGTNLAVAVGIADALGVEINGERFEGIPRPEHRQNVIQSTSGFAIIDDTFNSNPAGAAVGLNALALLAPQGKRVIVTPGMVELGPLQASENENLARAAAEVCTDIVIVGRTNRRALLEGSSNGKASVTVLANRDEAVDWVKQNLGTGDAVLYENDLPDHYP